MAEIKWIKITTDIFDDEKILLIESMPEADSLIVIWFKLLAFAGKSNNNGVFMLSNKIPYTEEMLATIFRRPINTVRLALSTFESFGMIEYMDGVLTISNWEKHQNVDGMEKIREQNRKRVAAYREKQKLLSGNVTSNATVTECNAVDKDKEEEKEKDKDKELYKSIVDYLNEKTGKCFRSSSKKTRSVIRARLEEGFTLEDFKTVIDKKCIDWLNDSKMDEYLRPETLFGTKFEGYLNAKNSPKKQGRKEIVPSWINENPEEDTKRLEKLLADLQKGDDP